MTTIYLIRHSDSLKKNNINYNDLINEQEINERLPLSIIGEEKALKLSKLDELSNIDVIYSSLYIRAISTAKYIADKNNLILNITSDLNERKLGAIDGVPESFWLTQLENELAKTICGESRKEVCERMLKIINSVLTKHKDKKVVLVSHATAITFLLMNWCELISADFKTKSRHLKYKGKDILNGKINSPELFKLEFKDNNLINIELITN